MILSDGVRIYEIDLFRHKGAIFFQHLTYTVFIAEFIAVFVQIQGDLGTCGILVRLLHLKFRTAVTFPIDRLCAFFVGQRFDGHLVSHHEGRIKSQSEMSDDLVFIGFILILLHKSSGSGEGDLVDVFLHFVRRHADSVIDKLQGLLCGIGDDLNGKLLVRREIILSHNLQLPQLRNGVAAIGNHFPDKDVVVGIQPLLDNGKYIFTVNG